MLNYVHDQSDPKREATVMPKATTSSGAKRSKSSHPTVSPIGSTHRAGSSRRARRSAAYREELRRLAPYEGVARIVIARRQALGLTQQELAERVGTSHSVISRIESGQHPTSVTTLRRLAAAFETHLVVGFNDEPDALGDRELVAVS
jgi:ribosome-binding protein aMBF1 (putative translation factor)